MSIRPVRFFSFLSFLAALLALHLAAASAAPAPDYSHARVVRLSLVQGEVKVSRTGGSGDALGQNLTWEQALINLPIREGFVLATGQGRTEVEFESGAAAYLAENSVLQFTELALSGGARITRLTLTQGTATFFANPSRQDSFVVKTPTLEVALNKKGRIRVDTYDDGVSVSALHGGADVTSNAGTKHISKGQSLSLGANRPNDFSISAIPKNDEWDRWVADREESVQSTATMTSNRLYSPYYQAGVAELSVYGTWISYGGFDNCWRPLGVSYGWTPFSSGRWSFYPGFGWTWVSAEPWGWLPYHFGGWVFSPVYGWLWVPGQPQQWQVGFRPATAVFVQVNNQVGWLPMHPLDRSGDTPLNMEYGVTTEGADAQMVRVPVTSDEKIQVLRDAPRGLQGGGFHSAVPPERVSRKLGDDEDRHVGEQTGSGIVYDGREKRFVNANPTPGANPAADPNNKTDPATQENRSRWETGSRDVHHITRDVDVDSAPVAPNVPGAPSAPVMPPRMRDYQDSNEPNDHRGTRDFGNGSPAPQVPPTPQIDGSGRPALPESAVPPGPSPQAPIGHSRRLNREDMNSIGHDDGDGPRSINRPRWSSAPPQAAPPMPPSAPARVEPPPSRPMPMPAPRMEPIHQESAPAAPRYSPPPAPVAPQNQGDRHEQQGNHEDHSNHEERPPDQL